MTQDLVIAVARREPRTTRRGAKAFSVAALRGLTIAPTPVAVAEFASGEKIRMSFCQMAGKPWNFVGARQLLAQAIGNERGRMGGDYAAAHADLERKIAAARAIADDPGIGLEEADTARKAVERLEQRRAAAIKKAQTDVLHAFFAKYSRVYPPATDFRSFHIEYDGKVIDPLAIENRPGVKTLAEARRRLSLVPVSIPDPDPLRTPTGAPAYPPTVADTVARINPVGAPPQKGKPMSKDYDVAVRWHLDGAEPQETTVPVSANTSALALKLARRSVYLDHPGAAIDKAEIVYPEKPEAVVVEMTGEPAAQRASTPRAIKRAQQPIEAVKAEEEPAGNVVNIRPADTRTSEPDQNEFAAIPIEDLMREMERRVGAAFLDTKAWRRVRARVVALKKAA